MDHSSIGPYLKWISQDILKEEIDTITENGLEWKDMHRPINKRARNYILDVIENDFSV
jgi:DNA-binding cell septation regulator SpoVG